MRKALAHEAQIEIHAGHASSVRKRLRDVLNADRSHGKGDGGSKPPVASVLTPGTRLVREGNGRTETVEVAEDGFRMDGHHHRSQDHRRTLVGTTLLRSGRTMTKKKTIRCAIYTRKSTCDGLQGNRVNFLRSNHLCKEVFIPCRNVSLDAHAVLSGSGTQQV